MVKLDAPQLLRAELESPRWQPQVVVMSGVTDPYQPIEKKLRIARGCLEMLAKFRNPVAIHHEEPARHSRCRSFARAGEFQRCGGKHFGHIARCKFAAGAGAADFDSERAPRSDRATAQRKNSRRRDGRADYSRINGSRSSQDFASVRESRRAICRLHDCAIAVGGRAVVRALARRTFSRSQRENSRTHPRFARQRQT